MVENVTGSYPKKKIHKRETTVIHKGKSKRT